MFELDPQGCCMMPAHFGPRPQTPRKSSWYRDVTSMTVTFLTEPDALAAYLPTPYRVADIPTVTITYACNRNVDWLAGRDYNMIAVNAAVVFEGDDEILQGNYAMVVWENLTDPILVGRELQGIPKIYADIADHSENDGRWHASAEHYGHKFLDLEVSGLAQVSPEDIAADMAARADVNHPMGWRFLPGVHGPGMVHSEKTTFPSKNEVEAAWVGDGHATWQQLDWEQNPTQCHIINALGGLPVSAWLPAVVARGATNLMLPEQKPRKIR